MADHVGLVLLVLEVLDGADTAHDDMCLMRLHVIRDESRERIDLDIPNVGSRLTQEAHALFNRKERLLVHIVEHADDDLVKHRAGPLEDVDVAIRDGVETAGTDGTPHISSSSRYALRWKKLSCVVWP